MTTGIPLNPATIAGAGVYTSNSSPYPLKLCSLPKEGAKAISMQFAFNVKTGWLVNFANIPNQPLSQLCALYVDCSNSDHDVTILFPDSGYSVRINSGGARMVPVITAATGQGSLPLFYVLLDSSDVLTTDTINVIALNIFVPEFQANELQPVLSYGYGMLFEPQPLFTQSTSISYSTSGLTAVPIPLITAKQWYITGLIITAVMNTKIIQPGAAQAPGLFFTDGTNINAPFAFVLDLDQSTAGITKGYNICQLSGLQYISSGTGGLSVSVGNAVNIVSNEFIICIQGGILVP